MKMQSFVKIGVLALILPAMAACSALGGKNPPDEFAITTKAPLVVPPDYALRPPKPGESRPQELSSSCLLYTSPSPRDRQKSRMPSSA